jgi:trehalose 6-phosphate synthase/phosphatase
MISGIRSLSTTHEQIIVGWTGDIHFTEPQEKVPVDIVSKEDRVAYEDALKNWTPKESDPDDDKKTTYVPVWLDDKVAHGHYDGYCKESKFKKKRFSGFSLSRSDMFLFDTCVLFFFFFFCQFCGRCSITCSGRMLLPSMTQLINITRITNVPMLPFLNVLRRSINPETLFGYTITTCYWCRGKAFHLWRRLLMPMHVCRLVRESIPDAALGLFVHTPFPSSEVFRCLPRECLCLH